MAETRTIGGDAEATPTDGSFDVRSVVRKFGGLNVFAGLLALIGPAVYGNDDDGLVNVEPGLFLGRVAVNGRHALVHVLVGLLGARASGDADAARGYLWFVTAFFGAFAAVGWRQFGFERGVHVMAGMAVDGWGNLGHAVLAAFGLLTLNRSRSESQ